MANIITVPLPQDLPTNWVYGQTIGPQGTDVGLTQQHGYNYLMEQVNAAQQAAQELGDAVGNPDGIASLGPNGQVPLSQLPQLQNDVTLYVNSTTGNDENTGTQQAPFATIQAAVDSLPKNLSVYKAVINIADGTYNEDVLVSGFYGTGSTVEYFRFYGMSFVGSSGVTVRSIKFVNNLIPCIFVSGITVSGGTSIKQGAIEAGTGIVVQGCNHVDFNGCNITNCINGLQVGSYYTTGGTTVFFDVGSVSNCSNFAIYALGITTVFLNKVSGNEDFIGLCAQYGGHIVTLALDLTATTEQSIYAGFIDKF